MMEICLTFRAALHISWEATYIVHGSSQFQSYKYLDDFWETNLSFSKAANFVVVHLNSCTFALRPNGCVFSSSNIWNKDRLTPLEWFQCRVFQFQIALSDSMEILSNSSFSLESQWHIQETYFMWNVTGGTPTCFREKNEHRYNIQLMLAPFSKWIMHNDW